MCSPLVVWFLVMLASAFLRAGGVCRVVFRHMSGCVCAIPFPSPFVWVSLSLSAVSVCGSVCLSACLSVYGRVCPGLPALAFGCPVPPSPGLGLAWPRGAYVELGFLECSLAHGPGRPRLRGIYQVLWPGLARGSGINPCVARLRSVLEAIQSRYRFEAAFALCHGRDMFRNCKQLLCALGGPSTYFRPLRHI
jgi:hypothetical protein